MDEARGPTGLAGSLIQQAMLLELLDHAPALVFVADQEMRYLAVNATACETLGYSRDELLAMRVTDVAVEPEAPELYAEMIEQHAQSGITRIRTKDGHLLPFRYAAGETALASLRYYIAIGFVDDEAVAHGVAAKSNAARGEASTPLPAPAPNASTRGFSS